MQNSRSQANLGCYVTPGAGKNSETDAVSGRRIGPLPCPAPPFCHGCGRNKDTGTDSSGPERGVGYSSQQESKRCRLRGSFECGRIAERDARVYVLTSEPLTVVGEPTPR